MSCVRYGQAHWSCHNTTMFCSLHAQRALTVDLISPPIHNYINNILSACGEAAIVTRIALNFRVMGASSIVQCSLARHPMRILARSAECSRYQIFKQLESIDRVRFGTHKLQSSSTYTIRPYLNTPFFPTFSHFLRLTWIRSVHAELLQRENVQRNVAKRSFSFAVKVLEVSYSSLPIFKGFYDV